MSIQSEEIEARFVANLKRVDDLVKAFRERALGRGRSSVVETDILRAAVVLLHASFEELLRSTEEWRLPYCRNTVFAEWPIVVRGQSKREKITLAELLEYRGSTIDEVLNISIRAYLERSNYNSVTDVANVLNRLGLETSVLRQYGPSLEAMMKRRHWIAHRADRNQSSGRGQYVAGHLTPETVEAWLSTTRGFGESIVSQLHRM